MLRLDLCDYSDAYMKLAFKNNVPFAAFIPKINGFLIGNAENLDAAIPMYNLFE